MEERLIEVDVVSAAGLTKMRTFGRQQNAFVVAYILRTSKRVTEVDTKGGLNPSWNSKLVFICDERGLNSGKTQLTLEIYSRGVLSNKLTGTVSIPLHLSVSSRESTESRESGLAEYPILDISGKTKGLLKVRVKYGVKRNITLIIADYILLGLKPSFQALVITSGLMFDD
ncbi:hypothetical protein R1sor_005046 [Riccia sorocarpa]|uniref:C2 domain-containing protein n=1 Tax=Riccia sorocarpa TaxID=122646 RepID=A0ABD3HIE7_9MARC